MNKQDFYYLGKIVSKYSFKGELLLKIESDEINFKELKSIFIEIDGSLVPFKINKLQLHKSSLLRFSVEGVDNEIKADRVIKSEVFLPINDLPPLSENKFYYHEISGFKVIDNNLGEIGKVMSVNDQTSQPVLIVKKNEKEIMIPLVDEFLIEVDRKEKKLIFELPDGITNL
ncbi:MAG: 16S rRNA processing protein RimM [Flavobacteriaceae bacterium]|nr:16S rRNA processing protein RimM [Flavobacteriaceae bacterium]